jgi:hypothetical protein
MSAPSVSGRWQYGVANVLSITICGRGWPFRADFSHAERTAPMSMSSIVGFAGDSK